MTTVTKGRVKGEGRIISLNEKFGFLGAQGIKSKVFIIPSSLKSDPPFPRLSDVLEVDDIVYFEATEQPERNGAKYVAVDGTVRLKQRGKDVMHEGEGKIVQVDKNRGYFGFIEADVGNVFFNISAVRPSTNDVTKVLKVGQKVKFRCLPNSEQPNCKWRASLVVPTSKAAEYMRQPSKPVSLSWPKSASLSDYESSPTSPIVFRVDTNSSMEERLPTPTGKSWSAAPDLENDCPQIEQHHRQNNGENVSAMWDNFLQQQQALLHPWYAEGRENFYITSHNFPFGNNNSTNGASMPRPLVVSPPLDSNSECNSACHLAKTSDDGFSSGGDDDQRPHESICRQMTKLAHELNGWQEDCCPFCCTRRC